jgi:hypothetical protein
MDLRPAVPLLAALALAAGEVTPVRFQVVPQDNPRLRINELFIGQEDLRSPRFAELRARFQLDAVVRGVDGEFARILALRHWIKQRIRIEDDNPSAVAHMDAMDILVAAEAGGGFHCAHFRLVQQAVLSAYGHVTRSLGVGDGRKERGRHHGVNEVWVNELGKWVLTDAKYDLHYEKAGVPLSALEMRAEILADGGAKVERAYGPQRERREAGPTERMETYRWLSWELNGNVFSNFPGHVSSALVAYEDDYTRANSWYRDGSPHWAYAARFFIPTPHATWIEWTPNVISSHVDIVGERARIGLGSCTPNFRSYAMRLGATPWADCGDRLELAIPADGLRLEFRVENLAGVAGPVHRVVIAPLP